MTPIKDTQLGAIVYLKGRPGTPSDIRELLKNPLIEQTSKQWGIEFIGKLSDGEWDWIREAMGRLEDRNSESMPAVR